MALPEILKKKSRSRAEHPQHFTGFSLKMAFPCGASSQIGRYENCLFHLRNTKGIKDPISLLPSGNKGRISLLPSPESKGKYRSYFLSSVSVKQRSNYTHTYTHTVPPPSTYLFWPFVRSLVCINHIGPAKTLVLPMFSSSKCKKTLAGPMIFIISMFLDPQPVEAQSGPYQWLFQMRALLGTIPN